MQLIHHTSIYIHLPFRYLCFAIFRSIYVLSTLLIHILQLHIHHSSTSPLSIYIHLTFSRYVYFPKYTLSMFLIHLWHPIMLFWTMYLKV